jgi:hypothetical protein
MQDRGDGVLVLVPATIPKAQLADRLPPRLTAGLRRYNATCATEARIRLRMSLHAGDARLANNGIVGNEVNFACRLVDSDGLRAAHRNSAELISIIVSDGFYREGVVHEPAAEPQLYRAVMVQEKEVSTHAWIRYEQEAQQEKAEQSRPRPEHEPGWQTRMWVPDAVDQGKLWPLVHALNRVTSFADREGRALLVRMLSDELPDLPAVEDHRQTIGHLFNIAEACRRHPEGLTTLVEVLGRIEDDADSVAEVHRAAREMSALELWPAEERKRLFNLLAGVVVPEIPEIYRIVAGPAAPGLQEQTTYLEVFRTLEQLNAGPSGVPKPLIFIEHVAAKVRPELAIELRRWADQQAERMELQAELKGVRQDLRNAAGAVQWPQPSSEAYLVIQLQVEGPAGGQYRLSHWRQLDLSAGWAPIRGQDITGDYESMKQHVAALVEQVEGDWVQYQPDIRIEFVLDYQNINLDVDLWPWETQSPVPEPLGCRYLVAVRSLERMVSVQYHGRWRKRWQSLQAQLGNHGAILASASHRGTSLEPGDLRGLMSALNRNPELVALVLGEPPHVENTGRDEVAIGIRAGVPVIVWHRSDCCSPEFTEPVGDLLHGTDDPNHLLERARLARITAFEEGEKGSHFGGELSLLYDDPFRVVVPSQPTPPAEEVSVA